MKRMLTTAVSVLSCVLVSSSFAEPVVQSMVDAASVYEGQGFVWTLSVTGAKQAEGPNIATSPDFFVKALEPAIREQAETRTYIYRYRVIPRRAGNLSLPAVEVVADEETLIPEPRVLRVSEARSTDALRLEVQVSRAEVYIGQPFVVTVSWYSSLPLNSIQAIDFRLPFLYHRDFDVYVPEAERMAGGDKGTIGLPVEGQRVIARVEAVQLNEQPFQRVTFQRILVPKRAGTIELPPARLLCSHLPGFTQNKRGGNAYPSYFDNDFFHAVDPDAAYIRYGVRAEPISLTVRALPAEGRPPTFSGIVGVGQVRVESDTQTLTLGEPVTLSVHLSGYAQPEVLHLPALSELADLNDRFLVPDQRAPGRVKDGEAVFVQSLRPLRTSVTKIPSLALDVFDPEKKTYTTLTSEPIPLRVLPDGERSVLDLGDGTGQELTPNPDGVWHNASTGRQGVRSRLLVLLHRTWWAWFMLPPALTIALIGPARNARLRRGNPEGWEQRVAFSRMNRAFRAGNPLFNAATTYLAVRLGIREGAVTCTEVESALRKHDVELATAERDVLRALFRSHEVKAFGRDRDQPATPPNTQEVLRVLQQIERRVER